MGRLTGGSFTYNERRRVADYEHNDATVTFNYSFDPDDKGMGNFLDSLQAEIRARVRSMVSGGHSSWDKAVDKVAEEEDRLPELPKPKRGRKPKTPAPVHDELPDPEFDGPASGEADTIDDVIDEDDDEETVGQEPGPSVDEVVKAVTEKNKLVKDPPRLKAFIKKWAPASREIPAGKRAEFLEALKKFK